MQQLNENDLPHLLALSQEAGWEHTEADWQAILKTGSVFGKRSANALCACGALFEYGNALSSIGMVIVTPSEKNKGLGTEIMNHLIAQRAHPDAPVMLVAGATVGDWYDRFGFKEVEWIHKLQAAPGTPAPESAFSLKQEIFPLEDSAWDKVLHIDREVFGADRSALLKLRYESAYKALCIQNPEGTLLGYGMCVVQGEQLVIGPLVGFNRFSAIDLMRNMMEGFNGPIRIDVSSRREDLVEVLKDAGFEKQAQQSVMVLGAPSLPGKRDHLFALASQAWG